jgi:hypothetical protein
VSAFVFRGDATASTDLEDPRNFVAAVPLRKYQETKDTDGDGLRDWFEELSGTDPNTSDAGRPENALSSSSTTPFVADTETERFAVSFFDSMLEARKDGLTETEKKAIVTKSLRNFKTLNEDTLYGRADITIIEDGSAEAIRAYGNAAATPIVVHGNNDKNVETELVLLGTALAEDDPSYLEDLAYIEERYAKMVEDLLSVPVPEPLIDEHLLMVNGLQAMRDDVAAFRKTFDDPIVSFVRFKRYTDDVKALTDGIEGVRRGLESARIVYRNDEPGAFFFSLRP